MDDLVALRLVPVEVFGTLCDTHCEEHEDPACAAFGLSDAVEGWSDCNRADGRIYRVDDPESAPYREPGDTVEIFVRRADLPWFQKRFGDRYAAEVIDGETVKNQVGDRRG